MIYYACTLNFVLMYVSLTFCQVELSCKSGMEFGRVSGDHYAGYVVEDSDLEYSDCSEADR